MLVGVRHQALGAECGTGFTGKSKKEDIALTPRDYNGADIPGENS
jgi:hypothetical protein